MADDNLTRQADEIEALSSIYDTSFKIEDESNRSYSIAVEEGGREVVMFFKFPDGYPADCPPVYQVSAPWLKGLQRMELRAQLENVFLEQIGEPVIFQWVEKLREFLQSFHKETEVPQEQESEPESISVVNKKPLECVEVLHGDPLSAGKCCFQGHTAIVKSTGQVKAALQSLYEIKKVANATHNMYAYRIDQGNGHFISDCDDDGETHAGGRLLHLLEILGASDVLVVVTRWFGGVHLGPARFQHINNAARQALVQAQIINDDKKSSK